MNIGAISSAITMARNAIVSLRPVAGRTSAPICSVACAISRSASEQSGRPDQQDDRHDDKDYGVGRLGKKYLGQPLDDAEREAGDDRAQDRTHAADHHDREYHDDE